MALPELVRKNADKVLRDYCAAWFPSYTNEPLHLTYLIEDETVTLELLNLASHREPSDPTPLARLRYSPELKQWTLYAPDGNGHWRIYFNARPSLNLDRLLKHLKEDPFGFFRV